MKKVHISLLLLSLLFISISCKDKKSEQNKTDNQVSDISDEALLDSVQRRTFQYFWDGAEPVSGMARERFHVDGEYPRDDKNVVTAGGSGFGIMALISGIDRGYVTREQGLERMTKIVNFLEKADSFHGVYPHWWYGETGKVRGFSDKDNGGDLVETAVI